MSKLLDLMRKLGSDAALEAEYERDPESVLDRAGLSSEERRAITQRDYQAIRELTGLKDGQYATKATIKAYDDQGEDGDEQGDGDDQGSDG